VKKGDSCEKEHSWTKLGDSCGYFFVIIRHYKGVTLMRCCALSPFICLYLSLSLSLSLSHVNTSSLEKQALPLIMSGSPGLRLLVKTGRASPGQHECWPMLPWGPNPWPPDVGRGLSPLVMVLDHICIYIYMYIYIYIYIYTYIYINIYQPGWTSSSSRCRRGGGTPCTTHPQHPQGHIVPRENIHP